MSAVTEVREVTSTLARAIGLQNEPVSIRFTDDKPDGAAQFSGEGHGCVIALLGAAAKGRVASVDREHLGCHGAATGLCLGSRWQHLPGGIEYFLSTGRGEGFPEGEHYFRDAETAKAWTDTVPITDLPTAHVVLEPLSAVPEGAAPDLVCFLVDGLRLSALHCLAHYGRGPGDHVRAPFGAGCHSVCLLPYHESKREQPRAIVGCLDITVRTILGPDTVSFTVPWAMYRELEANVAGSFLEHEVWARALGRAR